MNEKTRLIESASINQSTTNSNNDLCRPISRPPLLRTWLRIVVGFIGCTLASGVLTSYPTLAAMFANHGIFGEACGSAPWGQCESQNNQLQLLYYVSVGVSVGCFLLLGQSYDRFGPKIVAAAGAGGVMVGSYLMYVSVAMEGCEQLLWLAVPLVDLFGFLNSFALLGFIFHDEPRQAVIMGVANASYTASSAMMNVLVALNQNGWSLSSLFLFSSACAFGGAVICALSIPTQAELFEQAERVLGVRPQKSLFRPLHAARDALSVMRAHTLLNALFVCATILPYIYLVYWTGSVFQFLALSIGDTRAQSFSDTFALMFTIISTLLAPVAGQLFEWLGMRAFVALLMVIQIALAIVTVVSMADGAILFTFVAADALVSTWQLLLLKWSAIFAPPELLGSFFGAIFSTTGLLQLSLNFAIPAIMQAIIPTNSPDLYWWPYLVLGVLASLALFGLFIVTVVRRLPSTPPQCTTTGKPLCG
jgi:hypothetical protein